MLYACSTAVPQENIELLPVRVESSRYNVGTQRAFRGCPQVPLLVIAIIMPNNLVLILICIQGTSWVKTSDSPVSENSTLPSYHPLMPEGVTAALNLLAGRLELRSMFQLMLTEDLHRDLRQLMLIQWAIIHVLHLVEVTASDILRIFVDREAKWEQMQEDLGQDEVDEVVNAEHRVDNGESFNFDSNLDS